MRVFAAKASAWLRQNDEIAPVAEDYLAAASIRAKATRQGARLELTDCLIAAVAMRLGRTLITGNTDDSVANLSQMAVLARQNNTVKRVPHRSRPWL